MTCTCNYCVAWLPATEVTKLKIIEGGKDEHRELVLLSSLSLLLFFTVVSSQLHCSWCILSPGSRSWSQGLLQRCGKRPYPSSPVPTHGGWTPAGRGLSSQLAARRRRWPRRGNSSSTLTEPGTQRTPASPAGWSPWTITMCDTNTLTFLCSVVMGKQSVTWATNGVIRAPTLAIPLLVPNPKALVAVGYTCRVSEIHRRLPIF